MLEKLVADHYWYAVGLYLVSYAIIGAFAVPLAVVVTLLGGALFGVWWGTVYAVIGATVGATLAFLGVRYIVGDFLQDRYKDRLHTFNREVEQRGVYYLLSLRFLPLIPFFLVNVLAGLTTISFKKFLVSTSLGVTPGAFVYAYAGESLAHLASPHDVLSLRIIVVFVLLALLALLPPLLSKGKGI